MKKTINTNDKFHQENNYIIKEKETLASELNCQ